MRKPTQIERVDAILSAAKIPVPPNLTPRRKFFLWTHLDSAVRFYNLNHGELNSPRIWNDARRDLSQLVGLLDKVDGILGHAASGPLVNLANSFSYDIDNVAISLTTLRDGNRKLRRLAAEMADRLDTFRVVPWKLSEISPLCDFICNKLDKISGKYGLPRRSSAATATGGPFVRYVRAVMAEFGINKPPKRGSSEGTPYTVATIRSAIQDYAAASRASAKRACIKKTPIARTR